MMTGLEVEYKLSLLENAALILWDISDLKEEIIFPDKATWISRFSYEFRSFFKNELKRIERNQFTF
jgi:hypothetical protein